MRIRFRFTKLGKIRFTSHRDVARLWERALRRSALPVASTEGFSPRPKMHFGLALSTGHESFGEYIDIDFGDPEAEAIDLDQLPALLTPLLPVGLEVTTAVPIERSLASLQEAVVSCTWRIEVPAVADEHLRAAVAGLLAADTVPVTRERKGKPVTDDIRPAIEELSVGQDGVLHAELATQPRGVRPSELLEAMASFAPVPQPFIEGHVWRTHQWIVLDGARQEPLPPGATWAPHAQARAS